MSTATLPRPVTARPGSGGAPARRAVIRWAWRLFRREWRQQLLVLTLLTVAVAATLLGAAIGVNTPPPVDAGFGTADHLVLLPGTRPNLAGDIAALRQAFGTVDVIENQQVPTGLVQGAQLRAQDPAGPYGRPMLALRSGRYPAGPGETALTSGLADALNLRTGDVWQQGGRSLRVVGIVANPQNLLDTFALVAPGQVSAPSQVTVLFRATKGQLAAASLPPGVAPQAPQPPQGLDPAVVVFFFAVFGLVFVGLVAVAGFSVLARRRLRALGMLASLGATNRHVRLVMVANGAVVGTVAALAGTALGFAAWLGYLPRLRDSTHHEIAWDHLPWWLIAAIMVLAVLTATLAARRPARAVAGLPVMSALTGRAPDARSVHRSAIPGTALLVAGTVMLAFSGGWGAAQNRRLPLQLGGLLCTAIGLLLLAPACVALLGALAGRAPLATRLALRDLSRYRSRSGAALAAVSFAAFLAAIICLLATGRYADPLDYIGPNLPANQIMVYPPGIGPDGGDPAKQVPAGQTAPGGQSVADAIAAAVHSTDVVPLEATGAQVVRQVPGGYAGYPGTIFVATPALLRDYGIAPGSVDPAALLVTSRPGLDKLAGLRLLSHDDNLTTLRAGQIQRLAGLPTGTSDPNLLVTPHAVASLNLRTAPGGWLIRTAGPLRATEINAARQLAVAAGMSIETKNQAPSVAQVRNVATLGGILLALGVLAMTVGLIRSEAARDLRTLAATGASGRTRRNITGATAGALGLLGALLGTSVAYLATLALFRSQLSDRMNQVPVFDLALILVGLPVAATVGSWLLAGREPAAVARQAIE